MAKKQQTPKIVRAAEWARANGYEYMASVVKQHYATTYYHVVKIADVIERGDWIAAAWVHGMPWSGKVGMRASELPAKTILRKTALESV